MRHFGVKTGWVLAREGYGVGEWWSGKFIYQNWRDLGTFKGFWGGLVVRRECRHKTWLLEARKGWAAEQRSRGAGVQGLVRRPHFLRAWRGLLAEN